MKCSRVKPFQGTMPPDLPEWCCLFYLSGLTVYGPEPDNVICFGSDWLISHWFDQILMIECFTWELVANIYQEKLNSSSTCCLRLIGWGIRILSLTKHWITVIRYRKECQRHRMICRSALRSCYHLVLEPFDFETLQAISLASLHRLHEHIMYGLHHCETDSEWENYGRGGD